MPFQGIRNPLFNPGQAPQAPGQGQAPAQGQAPQAPQAPVQGQGAAQPQQQIPQPQNATLQQLLDNQQNIVDFMAKFGAFVQQDKDDREAIRKAAQQEHVDKLAADRDRAANQKELQATKEADIRAKEIPKCDGCTPELTRKWIQNVEQTIPYTSKTIRVASLSSIDDLHTELEMFLNTNNRNFVTWDALKRHLERQFLTLEDNEQLCNDVDSIMRGPTETVAKFGRRFKRAVHLAYPLAPNAVRDPMGKRFLRHRYLQGLNHPDLMGRILREGRPDTFEQAMDLAARYEADEQNVMAQSKQCAPPQYGPQYDRVEEPMDVNLLDHDRTEVNAYDGARPKRAIRGQ